MSKGGRRVEWRRIVEFFLVFVVLPTIVFTFVGRPFPLFLWVAYHVLVGLFLIQATMSYLTSFSVAPASAVKPPPEEAQGTLPPVPKTTFIVSAYLPNEVEVVEETLLNLLQNVQRPADGIEVILAYNSPHFVEDVEKRLRAMAVQWPELILANAYGSRSKSANLNYALQHASGKVIALLDADHLVAPDCLSRAWRWLATGADAVQGRCKVRNGAHSWLTSILEVEFEIIYGVSHQAKTRLFQTALFGGSGAYWKAEALKDVGFLEDRLTEDIDASLRSLLAGHRIVHDRTIVSRELAPETVGALWFQRKRWAQGWFQCSRAYQQDVLRSPHLTWRAKFLWTWLLMWRVAYDVLANLLWPVVFAYWICRHRVELPMTPFIWFAIFYTLLAGPVEGLVAYANAVKPRFPFRRYLFYAVTAFPYTLFKAVIHMTAIRDELLGRREWIISARGPSANAAPGAGGAANQ